MKQALENAIMAYVREFEKKQGVIFVSWIGSELGGYAEFNTDWIARFDEICFDIDLNAPDGLFEQWYFSGLKCNYKSYLQGCRI